MAVGYGMLTSGEVYVQCDKCGAVVARKAMSLHRDWHLHLLRDVLHGRGL